jgi:hypothetical protein
MPGARSGAPAPGKHRHKKDRLDRHLDDLKRGKENQPPAMNRVGKRIGPKQIEAAETGPLVPGAGAEAGGAVQGDDGQDRPGPWVAAADRDGEQRRREGQVP